MHSTDLPQPARTILSVGELNHTARIQLESCFKVVWVEGEISNFSRPSSGHIYFSLKDSLAQVRCAWFKNRQHSRPSAPFKDGMQVVVRARVSLFEGRGEFQLLVEQIEPAGFGPLQQQFEALKLKLNREGLFDPTAKKALPHLPHRIGVISSPTGAAIRDVLSVLQRRCPMIPVMLYPTPVQGEGADIQIIQALERAVTRNECQTLILCRGGGSIEDLWAFNSEALARALYACPIPIISGIGHDTDFTIADFVADKRAPTPSVAAEIAVPDQRELLERIDSNTLRMSRKMCAHYQDAAQKLDWISRRLDQQDPRRALQHQKQRIEQLDQRLGRSIRHCILQYDWRLKQAQLTLEGCAPANQLKTQKNRLDHFAQRLHRWGTTSLAGLAQRLEGTTRALDAVSPLRTLDRGYAIVLDPKTGHPFTHIDQTKKGEALTAILPGGRLECEITKIEPFERLVDALESNHA